MACPSVTLTDGWNGFKGRAAMKLSSDIIYENLSEKFEIICSGKAVSTLILEPPVFWYEGIEYQPGMICIGRNGEMTEPAEITNCLLISVGGRMPRTWNPGNCCLFSIMGETDLFQIFNFLQNTFNKYENWCEKLRLILHKTADIGEMLRITAPLLKDSIAFCNKHLEIMAQADPDGGESSTMGTILSADRVKIFSDTHARNIALREPFIYHLGEKDIYCINIYKQDSYQGILTLSNAHTPQTPGKVTLFEYFFRYFSAAVEIRTESGKSSLVTLKTVFRDILNCMSVSDSRIKNAMDTIPSDKKCWVCLAARPSSSMKSLPMEYLCMQMETTFPGSQALVLEPYVAILMPVKRTGEILDAIPEKMETVVHEFFGCAGASSRFQDIRKARLHFRQAAVALEMAHSLGRKEILYYFQNYALYYGLSNSVRELSVEYMLPEGLLELRKEEGQNGYDGWKTLKVYLDNEMNGTQTARDLYIHRTTLQNRLRRIEQMVDLTTAESRMYIRYCMYLLEMHEEMQK